MKRIRPSLRSLEKAERKSGTLYEAQQVAIAEVGHRIDRALDRIRVAATFSEFSGASIAQLGHARDHIVLGPERGIGREWTAHVSPDTADALMQALAQMWHEAYVAELLERARMRVETPPTDT